MKKSFVFLSSLMIMATVVAIPAFFKKRGLDIPFNDFNDPFLDLQERTENPFLDIDMKEEEEEEIWA